MYLVVLAILALVLTIDRQLYDLLADRGLTLTAAAGVTLLPAAVAWLAARRALRLLDREPAHPARAQAAVARGLVVVQVLLALGHGALLLGTPWLEMTRATPVIGRWPVVPGLLAVTPFVLAIVLAWIALYPAERAVRQLALEIYLLRGRPLRPVWALGRYVAYNLRHQVLFILVPMLLILGARDVVVLYQREIERTTGVRYAPDVLIGAAALLVAVITPEVLRHVWVTQRLPEGPLRDRLQALARRLRLRYRDILVWRSGGLVVNAAVMGVVAPLRYVLITDGMLEQLDDAKIEAVFGHEAGHVKRHHILFLLIFAFISGCAATIFTVRTQAVARTAPRLYETLLVLAGLALLLKWTLLFGWVSRRFERQADIFGVRTLALTGLPCVNPCAVHGLPGSAAPRTPPPYGLCSTAAHVFGEALHEVALLNGIRPDARSFRHSSIASRSRFLQTLALDPARARAFERRVFLLKAALFAAGLVAGAWAAGELQIWESAVRVLG